MSSIYAELPYEALDREFQSGLEAHRRGALSDAEKHYRRVLEWNADHAEALNNLGVALEATQRVREAEDCYRRAVLAKPDYVEAHCNLGLLQHCEGRFDEAAIAYRRALEYEPDHVLVLNKLGLLCFTQGALPDSEAYFRRALAVSATSADAHLGLGLTLFSCHRLGEAETHYRRALDLSPDQPEVHNNLGVLLVQARRTQEAKARFRMALLLDPKHEAARRNLDDLLRIMHRYPDASTVRRDAETTKPTSQVASDPNGTYRALLSGFREGAYVSAWKLLDGGPRPNSSQGYRARQQLPDDIAEAGAALHRSGATRREEPLASAYDGRPMRAVEAESEAPRAFQLARADAGRSRTLWAACLGVGALGLMGWWVGQHTAALPGDDAATQRSAESAVVERVVRTAKSVDAPAAKLPASMPVAASATRTEPERAATTGAMPTRDISSQSSPGKSRYQSDAMRQALASKSIQHRLPMRGTVPKKPGRQVRHHGGHHRGVHAKHNPLVMSRSDWALQPIKRQPPVPAGFDWTRSIVQQRVTETPEAFAQ